MRNGTLFPELWNGMDHWFADTFPNSLPGTPYAGNRKGLGLVDVEETENAFHLHFDIPGMKKEDVKIEIQANELKVSGTRNFEKNEKHLGFKIRERNIGSFERIFHLGEHVDLDSVEASFEDGVLSINLAKKPTQQPRQISIK